MSEPNRVVIDRIDWKSVLPVLRLASAFKHALQPGKLVVALVAVLVIHGYGLLLDTQHHDEVVRERIAIRQADIAIPEPFESVFADSIGPYEIFLTGEEQAIDLLLRSGLSLSHGFGPGDPGVVDALGMMFVGVPIAMYQAHPFTTILWGVTAFVLLMLAGGVICRMAATQVCLDQRTSLLRAFGFVRERWVWYLLTPLMPVVLIALLGAALALAGLVFFNLPVLDLVGGLSYGGLLLLGFVVAGVSLLTLFALGLMGPALSVEGSDGFDAIARSFNYVLFRPWQFAGYLFSAVVYAAVVLVLVGAVAGLTRSATYSLVGLGAFTQAPTDEHTPTFDSPLEDGEMRAIEVIPENTVHDTAMRSMTRHEAIMTDAQIYNSTVGDSAWLVGLWLTLGASIAAAVMFSVVCCLQTQVYVLLRRSADGTPMDQCDGADVGSLWAAEDGAAVSAEPLKTDTADMDASGQAKAEA